jgi:GNAT superfamily N-acetyltransferase
VPTTEIVALTAALAAPAGGLVAARHARERARWPLLPAAHTDPAATTPIVEDLLRFAAGVGACDGDGRLVGFLTGFESAPDPASPMARYLPARSSLMLVQGHAVAGDIDPGPLYADLFAALATRWLDEGITDHVVHVPIGDGVTEAAWVALGFGRTSAVAVRDLTPTGRRAPASVTVRVATPSELDVVERLVDEEAVFHAGSPMFQPYVGAETAAAVRAELAANLASDDHAFLVARLVHSDVGVLSVGPGLGSPLYVPDGGCYIAATAVRPEARGEGVGAALVDAALDWARDHGHRAACLHFATANRTSSSFWTGIGFLPVMAHLRRRLDERILTARPPSRFGGVPNDRQG